MVAPHGGTQGRFGTNPIAFGFPTDGDPIIYDIGTSAVMYGSVHLARRLGEELPPGSAFDPDGAPTTDPGPPWPARSPSGEATRAPGSRWWCSCSACSPAPTPIPRA